MAKHLIIYHANCLDGFGSYWAAQHWIKKIDHDAEIEAVEGVYGDPLEYFVGCNVYILDFSFSPALMVAAAEHAKQIVWIDHHKSAIEAWDKYWEYTGNPIDPPLNFHSYLSRDNSKSGVGLTWEYFVGQAVMYIHLDPTKNELFMPEILQAIQDRDLWKFNLVFTKEVCAYMATTAQEIDIWTKVIDNFLLEGSCFDSVLNEGKGILKAQAHIIEQIISSCTTTITIDGVQGLCCNAPYMFASEIGNILAKKCGSIGVTWFENSLKEAVFSLRSIDDTVDVSAIAKKFGGGGHKNAAGFKLEPLDRTVEGVQLWTDARSREGCGPHD